MKRRNPKFGCVRIAQQISHVFCVALDKDVVRRVLAKHYRPKPGAGGPSWLSFIAQCKDSLWSVDLFRCESILLKSHCVMVVMDVFTPPGRLRGGSRTDRWDECLPDVQSRRGRSAATKTSQHRP